MKALRAAMRRQRAQLPPAILAAHQQAGGASQMPSGFLRNATFDGASR